ncbi:hypothetical protein LPJ66_010696, partial [Kickxella alabastrina]
MKSHRPGHKPTASPPPSAALSDTTLDTLYLSDTRTPLDPAILSELLGTLQQQQQDTDDYTQITNPTVLLGLHSLDDFERQAANHHHM